MDQIAETKKECEQKFNTWKSGKERVFIEATVKAVQTEEQYLKCMDLINENSSTLENICQQAFDCKNQIIEQEKKLLEKEQQELAAKAKLLQDQNNVAGMEKEYMDIRKKITEALQTSNAGSGNVKMMQKLALEIFMQLKTYKLQRKQSMDGLNNLKTKLNLLCAKVPKERDSNEKLIKEITQAMNELEQFALSAASNVQN